MSYIDWLIVIIVLVALAIVGIVSRKYMKSVADFLVAGRGVGRFLGQTTSFAAGVGAVSIVTEMQAVYAGGWAYFWSRIANVVILMVIAISGFGIYRLRETRVMTLNELFERRYSRKLRIFCGMLCFISGTLNMGIFPYAAGKFFQYFLALPEYISFLTLQIPTFYFMMLGILIVSVWLSFIGGQVTLMATDYLQGSIMLIMTIVIGFVVYRVITFTEIEQVLMSLEKPYTMLNPFKARGSFGLEYILIMMFLTLYGGLTWAPNAIRSQGARDPREAKLIYMFGLVRGYVLGIALFAFVPMAGFVFMRSHMFKEQAAQIMISVSGIANENLTSQLIVPLFLKQIFPIGIAGLFIASMIAASISTHDSYLLSWAGVFIQDIVMPIRKRPLPKETHIKWLRWATIGVAGFIFMFSVFYEPKDYILMFMMVTGAIYTGGAGVLILGALYWRRATTAGAWAAMITGSIIAATGGFLIQIWDRVQFLVEWRQTCPFKGVRVPFIAVATATIVYVVVSLLTPDQKFDLDALLHRKVKDTDHTETEEK